MGCDLSKTKDVARKKGGSKKREGTEAGEMMVMEISRPANADVASQQNDAQPSQAAVEAASASAEVQQTEEPNAAAPSESRRALQPTDFYSEAAAEEREAESHRSPRQGEDEAADTSNQDVAATRAPLQDGTSEQSDVDFQVLSEEPPTFYTEPQTPQGDGEGEQHGQSASARISQPTSSPDLQAAEDGALQAPLTPPAAAAAAGGAESTTPTAQEGVPEPMPQSRTEGSSATPSHRSSSAGAPFLHTAAREEQRRQSRVSSMADGLRPLQAGSRGGGSRRTSQSGSPSKKSAQERPPWVDVMIPPVEHVEGKGQMEEYGEYAMAPPSSHRYVEQIDAEGRALAAPPSEASEYEQAFPEAAMPASTPMERVAARRRRFGGAAAGGVQVPPPQIHAVTQTNFLVPWMHAPPAALLIPHRAAFTDPNPKTEEQGHHRVPATQMPPPTAYYVDEASGGPRRLHLDPATIIAIEASTRSLVRAHTPVATGSSGDHNRNPSMMSQRSLPLSTMDAAMYRRPGKLPPSHLLDPVYGSVGVSQSIPESHHPYGEVTPPSISAAAWPNGDSSSLGRALQNVNGSSKRNPPTDAAAASRADAPLSVSGRSSASRSTPRLTSKAPPSSSDYGAPRYGDVDAANINASSYRQPPYEVTSNSRAGLHSQYSNPHDPHKRSDLPSEPSAAGASANAAGMRRGMHGSSSQHDRSNEYGVGVASASHPSKQSSVIHSTASWSPAEGASLRGDECEAEYGVDDGEAAEDAYQPSSHAQAEGVEEYDDAAAAATGVYNEHTGDEVPSRGEEQPTPTMTAVAAVPANGGHVVERESPEWQLLQPSPDGNRNLYQQAVFVAQMRKLTPI
ncbi:hypothetical protein ABL78_4011 [Leptomonas seymouri]|uniref:Uncharacterized protein n=1 Tax=Leptomonas seymouri TaxID=5684 RepID=A0A0N1HYU1_LEPSE|nr:hypothetical protein ABL78_4011 [Leptomonas seymouri]|eukprot:KPI86918.1 hypothetical protein ABL78_4011 [Leptomonas seymouri]